MEITSIKLETGLATEVSDRKAGDAKNAGDLDTEVKRATAMENGIWATLVTEVADRKTDTFNLEAKVTAEASARSAADTVHTNGLAQVNIDLAAESKTARAAESKLASDLSTESKARSDEDAKINGLLSNESKARSDADAKLTADVAAELSRAQAAEGKLSDRIDFIVSNTNPAALDSLTELVSHFNANGVTYSNRLLWLEGVVQELLNKSQ